MEARRRLSLSPAARDSIVEHALAVAPAEAVGLLGGTHDGRVSYVAPLPNLARDGAFLADPRAQFLAQRRFAELDLVAVAAYHSHPGGTPTLSAADRALAHPGLLQLIVGIHARGHVDMRAYEVGERVREVPVRIESPPDAGRSPRGGRAQLTKSP
jgi:proteasome lid subunit RPN8/RPN11